MPVFDVHNWKWENAAAGAVAGFATVSALHPLDGVRTRFQVSDGRASGLPLYKNTGHAVYTIARTEGLRGLYAGFYPAVFGSTISWGLYFFFYSRAKHRYLKRYDERLGPMHHLASAAEAGALVCLCTNPIWLVKTRLQLQTPFHQNRPYSGFSVYEELRKIAIRLKSKEERMNTRNGGDILNSFDYATLGASSKFAAILLTYPYQVIRSRLQQRPGTDGIPKYSDSWHVVMETARFEGIRGFYRGITSNLLKNLPAASITFVVYENVLSLLRLTGRDSTGI